MKYLCCVILYENIEVFLQVSGCLLFIVGGFWTFAGCSWDESMLVLHASVRKVHCVLLSRRAQLVVAASASFKNYKSAAFHSLGTTAIQGPAFCALKYCVRYGIYQGEQNRGQVRANLESARPCNPAGVPVASPHPPLLLHLTTYLANSPLP